MKKLLNIFVSIVFLSPTFALADEAGLLPVTTANSSDTIRLTDTDGDNYTITYANLANQIGGGSGAWVSATGKVTLATPTDNVGIGSINPTQRLDVNGSVKAISFLGDGSLLTGIAGTNAGRVTTLSCADNIDTAIIAATAGDTLELGSCTYSISTAFTPITKSIRIKGQGKRKTIINTGSNVIAALLSSTSDGLQLADMTITGTRLTTVVSVDLQGGTSSSGINNIFSNIEIDAHNTVGTTTAIALIDTGGTIIGSELLVGGADWGSGGQSYGIINDMHSTTDVDSYLTIRNTLIDNVSTDTVGDTTSIIRGIRFYNYLITENTHNMYLLIDNATIKNRDDATPHNAIECLHIQGNRIYAYIYNSSLDGYGSSTTNTQNKLKDFRCDDGAECHFANTSMVGGFWQISGGTVYRDGYLGGNGIILDQGNQDGAASDGVAAKALFSGTGAIGGNASGTGSRAGGAGAAVSLTGGVGGIATAATSTGTGGAGGSIGLTGGIGGSQTTSSASANVGGKGGSTSLTAGAGGSATNGSSTNTGGNGGDVYLTPGAAGTGATANGTTGRVYMAVDTGGTAVGRVSIGSISSSAVTQAFNVTGSAQVSGNVGIGTTIPGNSLAIGAASAAAITAGGVGAVINANSSANPYFIAESRQSSSSTTAGTFFAVSNDNAALADGDRIGNYYFGASDQANNIRVSGAISAFANGAWSGSSNPTDLTFLTTPSGSTTRTEKFRITAGGNIGIGTTIPTRKLEVVGGAIKGDDYYSGDGTQGVTVTTCTGFKDGLCISGT